MNKNTKNGLLWVVIVMSAYQPAIACQVGTGCEKNPQDDQSRASNTWRQIKHGCLISGGMEKPFRESALSRL